MALYAFDGTGNEDRAGTDNDSNVLLFFQGYNDPQKNDDTDRQTGSLYLKGIGTRADNAPAKGVAEAFGIGGIARIEDAMKRLRNNMAAGDKVIDIVGFSRGAALAVDFANKIAATEKAATVRFLGVWDIVADFGLPGMHIAHSLDYPPNVQHCRHAMALDEHRQSFLLTRLSHEGQNQEGLQEVWFRGVHSDVGGGNGNLTLNSIALNWMYRNARQFDVPITDDAIALNLKRSNGPPKVDRKFEVGLLREVRKTDLLHSSVDLSDKGDVLFPHNNPTFQLARVSDPGGIAATAVA
jgi:uncharacterized protein (DUF2235 family)